MNDKVIDNREIDFDHWFWSEEPHEWCKSKPTESLETLTVERLSGEDLYVHVSLNKSFGFDLEIDGCDGEPIIRHMGLNPLAADSLAQFCSAYLQSYNRCLKQRENDCDELWCKVRGRK